jgi:predicted adenine nucleotide alpha hydrolase (AANH) superfamily ATPase
MKDGKIVLMSCCAPCSAAAIKKLKAEGRDFVVLFYNPNIFPRAEYDRRLDGQIKLCEKYGVEYKVGDYDHDAWLAAAKGLENEPERGARCEKCFAMRLKYGAEWTRRNGFGIMASVFGASKHKDNAQVLRAARSVTSDGREQPEYVDFGFEYAPEPEMYRQKYCGCEFSIRHTPPEPEGKS